MIYIIWRVYISNDIYIYIYVWEREREICIEFVLYCFMMYEALLQLSSSLRSKSCLEEGRTTLRTTHTNRMETPVVAEQKK